MGIWERKSAKERKVLTKSEKKKNWEKEYNTGVIMRFSIEKKELMQSVQHLISVAPTKSASPILTNYLIQASAENKKEEFTDGKKGKLL